MAVPLVAWVVMLAACMVSPDVIGTWLPSCFPLPIKIPAWADQVALHVLVACLPDHQVLCPLCFLVWAAQVALHVLVTCLPGHPVLCLQRAQVQASQVVLHVLMMCLPDHLVLSPLLHSCLC